MINPLTQHFMANRMGATVRSHRVDHTPMYSEPALAVDVILEAARKTLSQASQLARLLGVTLMAQISAARLIRSPWFISTGANTYTRCT